MVFLKIPEKRLKTRIGKGKHGLGDKSWFVGHEQGQGYEPGPIQINFQARMPWFVSHEPALIPIRFYTLTFVHTNQRVNILFSVMN
jgi:hypothetical protein